MKKKKHLKKKIALLLVVIIAASSCLLCDEPTQTQASFDESSCITLGTYAAGHNIPSGTKLVGTFLIDARAMTDELYARALESATAADQSSVYYKSELGGDQWYDISTASGVSAIESEGQLVDFSEISELYVKYYIDRNGAFYDVTTNREVYFYANPDFYNLEKMDEIEGLADLFHNYTKTNSEEKMESLDYYYYVLKAYLNLSFSNANEDSEELYHGVSGLRNCNISRDVEFCKQKYDTVLIALQEDYKRLKMTNDEEDEEISSVLYQVMEKVYAEKQSYYYSRVLERTNDEDVMDYFTNPEEYRWWDKDYGLQPDSTIMSSLGECVSNLTESIGNADSKKMGEPDPNGSELEKAQYNAYQQVCSITTSTPLDTVRSYCREYYNYWHIGNCSVGERQQEYDKTNQLMPAISNKFSTSVTAGVNSDYYTIKAALPDPEDDSALQANLEEQKNATEVVKEELQFMITARNLRTTLADKIAYLSERISWTESLKDRIPNDEFNSDAMTVVSEHITWLSGELATALEQQGGTGEEDSLAALEEKKAELMEEYEELLDDNDLDGASKVLEEINELNEKIAEKEEQMAGSDDPVDKASVASSDTLSGTVENLKNKAVEDFAEGKTTSEALDALVALGADEALDEIAAALGNDPNFLSALRSAQSEFKRTATKDEKNNRLVKKSKSDDDILNDINNAAKKLRDAINDLLNNGNGNALLNQAAQTLNGMSGDGSGDGSNLKDSASKLGEAAALAKAGDENGDLSDALDECENALDEADDALGNENERTDLTDSEIEGILGDLLNSADGKIIACVVLNQLGEEGFQNCNKYSLKLLKQCIKEKNKYLYRKYEGAGSDNYVSLRAVARITRYRYVNKIEEMLVSLIPNAKKGSVYDYLKDGYTVSINDKKQVTMSNKAKRFQKYGYYITEETTQLLYKVSGKIITHKVNKKQYCAAFTDVMCTKADSLYAEFSEVMAK